MKYHPDMQKTEEEKKKSSEVFKKIVTAYQVLRDKNKRSNYDRYGTE
jgi:DnaJ-class molecular chaperone